MPGSDDQYDQVHTYSQDHAGKSKTTKPAVREIGRDGAPVQLYVGQDVDASALRTPPANTRFLFFDQNGNLQKKNPNGTIDRVGGGAPSDASYVTTSSESGLSNETVAGVLSDVYGSPVSVGSSDLDLNGNALVDGTRGFVEVGSSDDLRIATNHSIEDGGGNDALTLSGSGNIDANSNDITNLNLLEVDNIGSGGGVTTTDITDLEGPGLQANASNQLESDYEVPQDVTSSRSLGTWETNTTGNPLEVNMRAFVGASDITDGDRILINAHANSSQTDVNMQADGQQNLNGANDAELGMSFTVPDGAEYKVNAVVDDTGKLKVSSWFEAQQGA